MSVYIAKLNAQSSFLDSLPRSDTIFGAFCWGWRWLGYNLQELLERVAGSEPNPPFLLSSMFPYVKGEFVGRSRDILLLPKPIRRPLSVQPDLVSGVWKHQTYQRIEYVTQSIFRQSLARDFDEQGNIVNQFVFERDYKSPDEPRLGSYVQVERVLYERHDVDAAYNRIYDQYLEKDFSLREIRAKAKEYALRGLGGIAQMDVLRNAIDRGKGTTGDQLLFKNRELGVGEGMGLYFLVDLRDDSYREPLERALDFISDRGFGGNIAVGKGQFEFTGSLEEAPQNLFNTSPGAAGFVTLALYYAPPYERQAWNKEGTWYELLVRKAKVDSAFLRPANIWKRTLVLFKEGSTFQFKDSYSSPQHYGAAPLVSAAVENGCFDIHQFLYAFPVSLR